jgi:hypothetical protein
MSGISGRLPGDDRNHTGDGTKDRCGEASPDISRGDVSSSWSPQQNIIASKQYDRLLETNPAFRQARVRKECGPITAPQLHASCLASFNQNEPAVGSSTPSRHYRSGAGG